MSQLQVALQMIYAKSDRDFSYSPAPIITDPDGTGMVSGVMTATFAADVAVPLSGIAAPGMAVFANLDETNFITLGYDDTGFVSVMKIEPGAFVAVSLDGIMAAPFVQADTADCLLAFTVISQ